MTRNSQKWPEAGRNSKKQQEEETGRNGRKYKIQLKIAKTETNGKKCQRTAKNDKK